MCTGKKQKKCLHEPSVAVAAECDARQAERLAQRLCVDVHVDMCADICGWPSACV